jgi:hypothetical protein
VAVEIHTPGAGDVADALVSTADPSTPTW